MTQGGGEGGGGVDLPQQRANMYTRGKSMGGNFDNFCIFLMYVITLETNFHVRGRKAHGYAIFLCSLDADNLVKV